MSAESASYKPYKPGAAAQFDDAFPYHHIRSRDDVPRENLKIEIQTRSPGSTIRCTSPAGHAMPPQPGFAST